MYSDIQQHNVTQEEYFQMDGISNSDVGLFLERPALYKAKLAGWKKPASRPMIMGSAFDALLLEPQDFSRRYAVAPPGMDAPSTEMQEALAKCLVDGFSAEEAFRMAGYKRVDPKTVEKLAPYVQFVRDAGSRDTLSASESETLTWMVGNTMSNPTAASVIDSAQKQAVFTGVHDETGLKVKGMLDLYVPNAGVYDIKTTGENIDRFVGKIFRSAYDRQLAHYAALSGVTEAGIIAVEREGDFNECDCFLLSQETLERGYEKMDFALKAMKQSSVGNYTQRAHFYTTGWRVV